MFIFFCGSLPSQVDMRGLDLLCHCKKEIRMKPKTAAAHMIISGASLPIPVWSSVCVLWKQSALWVFCPTHQAKPGAPQKRWEWGKFTRPQILSRTLTRTHANAYTYRVCTCSQLSNAGPNSSYTCAHIQSMYTVMHWAVKILISERWHEEHHISLTLVCLFCWSPSLSFVHSATSSFVPLVISPPSSPPFLVLSFFISCYSATPLVPAECTWVTLLRWQPGGR